ncbi:E3 ubiquitin-protein ligase HRD1 [Diplonema papillatum]|nr:E3 ubiquitin-protein ligase HRD1 [Diplonema papillatum]
MTLTGYGVNSVSPAPKVWNGVGPVVEQVKAKLYGKLNPSDEVRRNVAELVSGDVFQGKVAISIAGCTGREACQVITKLVAEVIVWETKAARQHAALQMITALPEAAPEPGTTCTVCLEDCPGHPCAISAAADAQWSRLPCGHHTHSLCLQEWATRNPSCPVCRAPLQSGPASDDE